MVYAGKWCKVYSGNSLGAMLMLEFSTRYGGVMRTAIRLIAVAIILKTAPSAAQSLKTDDVEYFKTHVEPILLKKRPGHTRCVSCHGEGAAPGGFGLQPLAKGMTTWTDSQSQQNYQVALRMIAPGDPTSSALLMHPLSPVAGGDVFHSGGRQFESQSDPDWLVMAEWVKRAKTPAYSNLRSLEPAELGRAMRLFDEALGVNCTFCHGRDFASDEKPMKEAARRMITLNKQINMTVRVSCFTCHRGEAIAKRAPDPAPPDF
jgi:cytochrome c553